MKNILCFGDSNTYGYIPGGYGRYEYGVRWTSILAEKLRNDDCRILEEGLCGRTTVFEDKSRYNRCGTSMLPAIIETHNPIDVVVVMLGTNDCKAEFSPSVEKIGNGIRKIISQVKENERNAKILLISPILLGESVWMDGFDPEFSKESVEISKGLKIKYKEIADSENIHFLAASDYANPSPVDMEHMDEEGHRIFAEEVFKKLKQII